MKDNRVFIFFSEISNCKVIGPKGVSIGKLHDLFLTSEEPLPRVSHIIIKKSYKFKTFYAVIPTQKIASIGPPIRVTPHEIKFSPNQPSSDFTVLKNLIDKQVVDVHERKIVRVNDLHLLKIDNELRVAHVDIGFRGIIRRLGLQKIIDKIIKSIAPKSKYLSQEKFISWKYIQPLLLNPALGTIRLTVPQEEISKIPPADLSDMLIELDIYDRLPFFKSLDIKTKADIFQELPIEIQKSISDSLLENELIEIIHEMEHDKAIDFLKQLPKATVKKLFSKMDPKTSYELSLLLMYEENSAGGLMTTEFLAIDENMLVKDCIQMIKQSSEETKVEEIYATDEKKQLKGVASLRKLLTAKPDAKLSSIALPPPAFVHPKSNFKEVAYLMHKYNLYMIPVVDENKTLVGIISIDDVLSKFVSESWRRSLKEKYF